MKQPIKLTQTIRKDGRFYVRGYVISENRRREFSLTETTADKVFETLRRLQHDIDAVRAGALGTYGSKRDSDKGAVATVSVAAPASVSQRDDTHGTEDIVFLLKDGQAVCFAATMLGRIQSNYYFESHARSIASIHFGESCYYVNNEGKVGGRVHMTRREFWELAKAGNLLQGAAV